MLAHLLAFGLLVVLFELLLELFAVGLLVVASFELLDLLPLDEAVDF